MLNGSSSAPVLTKQSGSGDFSTDVGPLHKRSGVLSRPERHKRLSQGRGGIKGSPSSDAAPDADSSLFKIRSGGFDISLFCDMDTISTPQASRCSTAPSGCSRRSAPKKAPMPATQIMLLPVDIDAARRRPQSFPVKLRQRTKEAAAAQPPESNQEIRAADRTRCLERPAAAPPHAILVEGEEISGARLEAHAASAPSSPSILRKQRTSWSDWVRWQTQSSLTRRNSGDNVFQPGMTLKELVDADSSSRRCLSGAPSPRGELPSQHHSARGSGRLSVDFDPEADETPSAAAVAAAVAEQTRESLREHLVMAAGGPYEAFRLMDLNNSKHISLAEFSDGLDRMGIHWQELTGFNKCQDVFRLFDRNWSRTITLEELFPEHYLNGEVGAERLSTPEFWNYWCRRTTDKDERERTPMWEPASPEEDLSLRCREAEHRQNVADERRRMAGTLRRLKKQGKSDARCRECVAQHLPRGRGPKDSQGVQTFGEYEVRQCRRAYNDRTTGHVRNIQQNVHAMREQRRVLAGSRRDLWSITMEPLIRAKSENPKKGPSIDGFALLGERLHSDSSRALSRGSNSP